MAELLTFYRRPRCVLAADDEQAFYLLVARQLTAQELERVRWLLAGPEHEVFGSSALAGEPVIEVGRRLRIESPFSYCTVSLLNDIGVPALRCEQTRRRRRLGDEQEQLKAMRFDAALETVFLQQIESFDVEHPSAPDSHIDILGRGQVALDEANIRFGFGLDEDDRRYYTQFFLGLGRNPTLTEGFHIANVNSDHCRHLTFGAEVVIDGTRMPFTLLELIRQTYDPAKHLHVLAAFDDNSGVIRGSEVLMRVHEHPGEPSRFVFERMLVHGTATMESHNYPTGVAPFPGAATGGGGRMRDSKMTRRGALHHAGSASYMLAAIRRAREIINGPGFPNEAQHPYASPLEIALLSLAGVASYGNLFGEPFICGQTLAFEQATPAGLYAYTKPGLFSMGCGFIRGDAMTFYEAQKGWLVVAFGGPTYPIGLGGGAASSMGAGTNARSLDEAAVQRPNAAEANALFRVITACASLGSRNPLKRTTDQGAGGVGNAATEISSPAGARLSLRHIVCGDKTMFPHEIWMAESQERGAALIEQADLPVLQAICRSEGVTLEVLGTVTGDGRIVVEDERDGTTPVDLPLQGTLSGLPRKVLHDTTANVVFTPLTLPAMSVARAFELVAARVEVGSKGRYVNRKDMSVGGCVVGRPICGPALLPVGDRGILAASMFDSPGQAVSQGMAAIPGLINAAAGSRMALLEAITNIAGAYIGGLGTCAARVNWYWPAKQPGELARLYSGASGLSLMMGTLGIPATGGKDSVSGTSQTSLGVVKVPGTVIVTLHAWMLDVEKAVTPDLRGEGLLGFIDLGKGKRRLGGSSLASALGQLGDEAPDCDDPQLLARAFAAIQELVQRGSITAYHDRSSGGLITTIAEMCMSGDCGADLSFEEDDDAIALLFNEEGGMVFEFFDRDAVGAVLAAHDVPWSVLGSTSSPSDRLTIKHKDAFVFDESLLWLRQAWSATDLALLAEDIAPEFVAAEAAALAETRRTLVRVPFTPPTPLYVPDRSHQVMVLRAPATNGDSEMIDACLMAGLDPIDVNLHHLATGAADLADVRAVIFPGGFSFSDFHGSGRGVAAHVRFNPRLHAMFARFRERDDVLSLGVCNGAQILTQLGWVAPRGTAEADWPFLTHNRSGVFESRWLHVRIGKSCAPHLAGMEGAVLGIWGAHGEGRFESRDDSLLARMRESGRAPIVYVGPDGQPTEQYPHNPNGSPFGIAAICNDDGRHLAFMPHPERVLLLRQMPFVPSRWRRSSSGPWLQLFVNMRDWLRTN